MVAGGEGSIDGAAEDLDRLADDGELVVVETGQQLAELPLVELAETLEQLERRRRRRDDDLASVPVSAWRRRSPRSTSRSACSLADDVPTPSRAASSVMRSSPAAITTYSTLAWAIVTSTSVNSGAWPSMRRCIKCS